MVICKYFLQGNCRFGTSCKFDHNIGDNIQSYTSVLRQQNASQATNAPNIDINMLVQSVSNDMQAAEKGGQWLFSCYAPFKEKSNFPGFEDKSFEELRLAFYEAQKNGTLDQYKQQLQMLMQDVMAKTRALQNPSADVVNIIKNIYNSPSSSNTSSSFGSSPFATTQNSPFGGPRSVQTGSLLGNNKQQSQTFGSNQSASQGFSSQSSKSIFAQANQKLFGNSNAPQQSSIFGGTQQGSGFGQVNSNQGVFRSNLVQQSQPQNLAFSNTGTSHPFAQNSPFATSQFQTQSVAGSSPFQAASQQPFGAQVTQNFNSNKQFANATTSLNTPTSVSSFTNQQQNSAFNNPNQNIFASQVQNQIQQQMLSGQQINVNQNQASFSNQNQTQNIPPFSNQSQNQNQSSLFGNQNTNLGGSTTGKAIAQTATPFCSTAPVHYPNSQSHSSSIFSSTQGNTVVENEREESFYSKPQDLSEDERKCFESSEFEFGKIPEKPPAINFCF